MALADIQQHIKEKTDKRIAEIRESAERDIAAAKTEWEAKLKAERERVMSEAQQTASAKLSQITFKIRERANSEKLRLMQQHIDEVYTDALKKLAKLDASEYEKLMEKLLKALDVKDGVLKTSKERESELKKAVTKTHAHLKVSSDYIDTVGGFILESEQTDIDNRFETLMARVKEDTLIEVNKILFGSNE